MLVRLLAIASIVAVMAAGAVTMILVSGADSLAYRIPIDTTRATSEAALLRPDSRAPVLRYKDEKGTDHFVTSVEAVPVQFRPQAQHANLPRVNYGEFTYPKPVARAAVAPPKRGGDGVIKDAPRSTDLPGKSVLDGGLDISESIKALDHVSAILGAK